MITDLTLFGLIWAFAEIAKNRMTKKNSLRIEFVNIVKLLYIIL
jgi:hypothetical protein